MSLTTTIEFPPTRKGIAGAHSELDRFAADLFADDEPDADAGAPDPEPPAPSGTADEAPRAVYRNATEGSRTRELLKELPGDITEALTPTEIGELLTANEDGSALNSAQVRAVMRNEKRIEYTLKKRGVIGDDREVVKADFTRYDAEGCGRYYVSAADHKVIQSL